MALESGSFGIDTCECGMLSSSRISNLPWFTSKPHQKQDLFGLDAASDVRLWEHRLRVAILSGKSCCR